MARAPLILIVALLLVACGAAVGESSPSGSEPSEGAAPPPTEERVSEPEAESVSVPEVEIRTNEEIPRRLQLNTVGWNTDFTRSTIDLNDLLSGGPPRDGIPPIDEPRFLGVEQAAAEVAPNEPVVAYSHNGDHRAYPLAILMWHEVVNDEVGERPVTITFCPLCNTAIGFDRQVGDRLLDFGTSGLLRNSDLVMWDRQTESLWQQATGEAIVGELAGTRLEFVPVSIISYREFSDAYPEGLVLSRETGHRRAYGANPYELYDSRNRPYGFFEGEIDDRLPALERVVGLTIDDVPVAYPFSALESAGVVNDEVAGRPIAVFYTPDTTSALDRGTIAEARAVGSAVPLDPVVDGERLTFRSEGDRIVDEQSGSEWDITGRALSGSMEGTQLEVLPHANHFWFAFQAFYPNVDIRGSASHQ